ncbi:hypothetical protein [Streptomyces sp. NPDC048825]|uniref:hypothetical protein n=1 Tax=Streptomyces sp. NPDC048825 TaxID=3365592 RepID=UPI0037123195
MANAGTHGRVPGRDFGVSLSLIPGSLRIEVTDTRTELRPQGPAEVKPPEPLADSGRGLLRDEAPAYGRDFDRKLNDAREALS